MAIPKKLAILHRHISLGIPITRHILHGPNSYQLSGLNSHALFGHSRSFSAPTGLSPPTIRDRITSLWAYIAKSSTAYYRGSKLLLEQTRQVRDLKSRQERHQYKVSRREFVLIKTNTDDAFRVVPFFIILILIPETLPLFLIKGANIIPSTCILPEQLAARRLKLKDVRVQLSLDAIESIKMGSVFDPVTLASHETMKHLAAVQPQHFIIDNMSHEQLVQYSKLMGFLPGEQHGYLKTSSKSTFDF
ncbi:hypothetical protein BSLG_002275 [Batrachochytrium salamandrivorans]|nr:hypothetical protein BSLG_002275 [Batrachochytrium salamandrivorans]